mgnify:FL=1
MRTLSLLQPWATLVAIGAKQIETRSWATSYRGPVAIHASLGFPRSARNLCFEEPFCDALQAAGYLDVLDLPRGVIIATATIEAIVPMRELVAMPTEPERSFGDYAPGRFAWFLGDINPLVVPIPAKGKLGLWECSLL